MPSQEPSSGKVNQWIALGLLHANGVSVRASPGSLITVFIIELLAKPPRAPFPPVRGGAHTTNTIGMVSQDYKPLRSSASDSLSTNMGYKSTKVKPQLSRYVSQLVHHPNGWLGVVYIGLKLN